MALLALTAMGAKNGLPPDVILLLPLLFASGMALIDTADGMLMLWVSAAPGETPASCRALTTSSGSVNSRRMDRVV